MAATPPPNGRDWRGAAALGLIVAGIPIAAAGAALLWGTGGGLLVGGLAVATLGVLLAWQ